jgi:hypothetical protein
MMWKMAACFVLTLMVQNPVVQRDRLILILILILVLEIPPPAHDKRRE